MPFKYQAPEGYKPTKLVIAGQNLDIKNGVLESDNDIIHILKSRQVLSVMLKWLSQRNLQHLLKSN